MSVGNRPRRPRLHWRQVDKTLKELKQCQLSGLKAKHIARTDYDSEADLETAIIEVQHRLFGPDRFYLDVKSKIGTKGSVQNIPDGYLLDLSASKPRLYVVENELQAHDPLRHIAVQILQFSLSFEGERLGVKKVLVRALEKAARDTQSPAKNMRQT